MEEMDRQINKAINDLADFWRVNTHIVYKEAVKTLIEKGFTLDEAIEFIEKLRYAFAEEYGE